MNPILSSRVNMFYILSSVPFVPSSTTNHACVVLVRTHNLSPLHNHNPTQAQQHQQGTFCLRTAVSLPSLTASLTERTHRSWLGPGWHLYEAEVRYKPPWHTVMIKCFLYTGDDLLSISQLFYLFLS